MARIALSLWNDEGSVAQIEDGDMNTVDVYLAENSQNPTATCQKAAKKLRQLADAFDQLATMQDPYKESTQRLAMKKKSKPSETIGLLKDAARELNALQDALDNALGVDARSNMIAMAVEAFIVQQSTTQGE